MERQTPNLKHGTLGNVLYKICQATCNHQYNCTYVYLYTLCNVITKMWHTAYKSQCNLAYVYTYICIYRYLYRLYVYIYEERHHDQSTSYV